MPQVMAQHSLGSLVQWLYLLTQGTVPNLHQIHFFLFCVPPALPQKKDEEIASFKNKIPTSSSTVVL